MPRVFVTRQIPDSAVTMLKQVAEVEVWPEPLPPSAAVLRAKLANVDGLLSLLTETIDRDLLDSAPRLRVIANMAVGYNNIDVAEARRRSIALGNTPGVLTDATADMVLALLLAVARNVVSSHQYAAQGHWKTWEPLGHLGVELVGKTVGIVGLGRIGTAVARRLHFGWNMPIIYHNRNRRPEAETELNARWVSFESLLEEADFVIGMTDMNPSVRRMFDASAFARMKRTAIFINAARGPLHDQEALLAALREGKIFGAGLDVTDPEPPPPNDPIFSTPRLVLTPHIASATFETRTKMAEMAATNIIAGLAGQPLPYPIPE